MNLNEFFVQHNRVAIAFSGGVDSAYLLYCAVQSGADVVAYYVRSQFQPQFEYDDAVRLADELGARMTTIDADVLADDAVRSNPANRCYYCKRIIFDSIIKAASADGYTVILDGTNASDDAGDRPGMRALGELNVVSPLRLCGLTKDEIRARSRDAGLFTWDKPAYACLATRIHTGEEICQHTLDIVEQAEGYLHSLGFFDHRVRVSGGTALIQVPRSQFSLYYDNAEQINNELGKYFSSISFDENGRGEYLNI